MPAERKEAPGGVLHAQAMPPIRVTRVLKPQRFTEPDLATLRDQFKAVLSEVAGEDFTVGEVLIPSIVPFTT